MIKTLIYISALYSVFSTEVFGQTKDNVIDDRVVHISKTLSVSPQKAKDIIAALDHKSELLMENYRNPKLKPVDKHKLLEVIVKERQQKLNELLTPDQVAKLKGNPPAPLKKYYDTNELKRRKSIEDSKKKVRGGRYKQVNKRKITTTAHHKK